MTSIGSWLWGSTQLDEQVDKATSELLPVGSEDIALNLDITDQIRSKAVPAKDAMRSLKRRLNHKNPNVQLLALSLTDTCVKNGGDHFLAEIASREFLDNLVAILRSPATNRDVHTRALRLIQNWALAFGSRHPFTYAGQVYADLKREGVTFPPEDLTTSSSAMVDTKAPPEWLDSDTCLYCRDPFTFTNRKHHCRNCGRVVDAKCSSHTLPLPHFGITQEVRVCEICWKDLGGKYRSGAGAGAGAGAGGVDPRRVSTHGHGHAHGQSRRARADDDADLQRAIRLSLEQTYGGSTARYGASHYVPSSAPAYTGSEPPLVAPRHSTPSSTPSSNPVADDEDDPELKAAIEASLREANAPRPSAPIADGDDDDGRSTPRPYQSAPPVDPNDLSALESDTILTFSQTVEQLSTSTGASRDLARYPAVTQLLDRATALRPRMAVALDDAGRKEAVLADMNEKLAAAVRIYDRILTEQVARPRGYYHHQQQQQQQGPYGMAQGTSAYQHAPYQQQYAPGPSYQPAYAQPQSPPPPVRQTTHPVPSSSPVQGLQRSNTLPYHPQYAPQPDQQQQQQYSAPPQPQQQQQYAAPSQQQYASPGPSAPPGLYAPPTPAPASAPAQPQYVTAPPPQSSAPTPAPTYQTQIQTQPSFQHASPPSSATSQTQFAPPTPAPGPVSAGVYQPQYASAPAPSAPTPVQVQPVAPQPAQPYTAPPPVQSYVSPPPAQHQQQQYAPPSSAQQQQQQYASPPPSQGQPYHPMPSFPVVPSNPPTTFNLQERSAFADPVPVKEASLIEL